MKVKTPKKEYGYLDSDGEVSSISHSISQCLGDLEENDEVEVVEVTYKALGKYKLTFAPAKAIKVKGVK